MTTVPFAIIFEPNETLAAFQLIPIQDEIAEPTECVSFSLDAVDVYVNTADSNTVTVCIEDDDGEYY